MQKLIMPFTRQMMLCGYKNPNYVAYWGFAHYGIDISSKQGNAGTDMTIYASGNGTVMAAGKDSKLGYGLAVLYKDCYNHKTGKSCDLVARYMHMSALHVSVGQNVTSGTKIATEGKEGTTDYHLHLEFDADTAWPRYSPQVAGGDFWLRGTDTMVNPSYVLHVGTGHVIVPPTYNPTWLNVEDNNIPALAAAEPTVTQAQYDTLRAKYDALEHNYTSMVADIGALIKKYGG